MALPPSRQIQHWASSTGFVLCSQSNKQLDREPALFCVSSCTILRLARGISHLMARLRSLLCIMLLARGWWEGVFVWERCFSKPFQKAETGDTFKDGDVSGAVRGHCIEIEIRWVEFSVSPDRPQRVKLSSVAMVQLELCVCRGGCFYTRVGCCRFAFIAC